MSKSETNAGPACRVCSAWAIRSVRGTMSSADEGAPVEEAQHEDVVVGEVGDHLGADSRRVCSHRIGVLGVAVDAEQPRGVGGHAHDVVAVVGGHAKVGVRQPSAEVGDLAWAAGEDVDAVEHRVDGRVRHGSQRSAALHYGLDPMSPEQRVVARKASPPRFRARDGAPVHEQIELWFHDAFAKGRFRHGDRLPTERDLATHLGVSRMTLRQSLAALETRGLVVRRLGRSGGTYVGSPRIVECDLAAVTGFSEQMRRSGLAPGAEVRARHTAARLHGRSLRRLVSRPAHRRSASSGSARATVSRWRWRSRGFLPGCSPTCWPATSGVALRPARGRLGAAARTPSRDARADPRAPSGRPGSWTPRRVHRSCSSRASPWTRRAPLWSTPATSSAPTAPDWSCGPPRCPADLTTWRDARQRDPVPSLAASSPGLNSVHRVSERQPHPMQPSRSSRKASSSRIRASTDRRHGALSLVQSCRVGAYLIHQAGWRVPSRPPPG